ncbi:MAG: hypothetical protein CBE00_05560 [Planctomycetaceae bacterium TMED240]|nr:hypothetical protein [Rhodopirellula sp.]OUX07213.1 MAG: hypothetical protein CBE00_05560 [Planctomycetaceae bacterium TMED240]
MLQRPRFIHTYTLPMASTQTLAVVCFVLSGLAAFFCEQEVSVAAEKTEHAVDKRPNIVVIIADDWSWPHASVLGSKAVKTPNFDRVAKEGTLFENAFVSTPSCTPSRLSILTGQHHWRLQEGDSLGGSLRESFPVYTELLQQAGYRIGRYGKGVWPSKHTFRNRDSFGERYLSFDDFLRDREAGQPFCFWYGGQDPHRPYETGIGLKTGINLANIKVPGCLPDNPIVRNDLADYLAEVQRFDHEVGDIIQRLESMNELDNTIVVVTSDNGMPFPRCKATLYDWGTRVPLAIRWGKAPPHTVTDFVTLCDLAPTFLDAASTSVPQQMTGKTLLPQIKAEQNGQVDPKRTFALSGLEKHVYPYPARSLRTANFLYISNWNPAQWESGVVTGHNPEYDFSKTPWPTEPGAFSYNIDPSPTKQYLRLNPESANRYAKLAFAQKPRDELYDLKRDPQQLTNLTDSPEYAQAQDLLRRKLTAELIRSNDPRARIKGYRNRSLVGWPIRISRDLRNSQPEKTATALNLIKQQLQHLTYILPAESLAIIRNVPIWLSPPYDGVRPTAEYHPGSAWLQQQGRRPELVECVELTNIDIFAREYKRMPMLMLHELAHAYHHQFLGFEHAEINQAYEQAKASGSYESILRGNGKLERAYGLSSPQEYFAETTEAFFGTNDFYPFVRAELHQHDPRMEQILAQAWNPAKPLARLAKPAKRLDQIAAVPQLPVATPAPAAPNDSQVTDYKVTSIPETLELDPFYKKYIHASGYPIVSSGAVNDYALKEAAFLVDMMLKKRPDIRQAMIDSGSRMIVMGHNEFTSEIPEYKHLRPKDFWDARARGLGGSRQDAVCSCAEENVLAFPGDPYSTENILIHEFAHNIHLRGLVNLDPTFDDRLRKCYDEAMKNNLWQSKYASTNHAEYFAEGVQSWFDNNRPPDHDHNHVDTRRELIEYDPGLAAICKEVFGSTELVYTKPQRRLKGHMEGYDPDKAPTFKWPARLNKTKQKIRDDIKKQGNERERPYKN